MSLSHQLSTHLNDWHKLSQCISTYAAYVALWAVLSAMTVYRREISCNRSYHKDDEDETVMNGAGLEKISSTGTVSSATTTNTTNETELMAEELLEGAGMYCSGRPILNFAELLSLGFDDYDNTDTENSANDMSPEDLLERVGNYASPEPILATIAYFRIWRKTDRIKSVSSPLSPQQPAPSILPQKNYGSDPLNRGMPPDVHVQIASFLHPRDVVNLACVSKAYNNITHDPNNLTCAAIWKTLWHRDYAWIVFKWKVGKIAFKRSNCTKWSYNKDFYFLFGQSYLDYVLAGHNTFSSCLVGIHSNIYDISLFLFSHPGKFPYGRKAHASIFDFDF